MHGAKKYTTTSTEARKAKKQTSTEIKFSVFLSCTLSIQISPKQIWRNNLGLEHKVH